MERCHICHDEIPSGQPIALTENANGRWAGSHTTCQPTDSRPRFVPGVESWDAFRLRTGAR